MSGKFCTHVRAYQNHSILTPREKWYVQSIPVLFNFLHNFSGFRTILFGDARRFGHGLRRRRRNLRNSAV